MLTSKNVHSSSLCRMMCWRHTWIDGRYKYYHAVRVSLRVRTITEYSTFPWAPQLESYYRMHFSVMIMIGRMCIRMGKGENYPSPITNVTRYHIQDFYFLPHSARRQEFDWFAEWFILFNVRSKAKGRRGLFVILLRSLCPIFVIMFAAVFQLAFVS